ncbi:MAG: RNA polymerase sigma factor [Ignavibacteriales bacterium]|nr:MAG: RNA polymerase sigma factor [Ignavibacteriales bacterium]
MIEEKMTSPAENKFYNVNKEDEDLFITRAKEGDTNAFEILYRNNVSRVYSICLRISSDKRLAEELTQDVFVKAWEKLKFFRGESLLSTWLFRIAVNTSLLEKRKRKRWFARFKNFSDLLNFDKKVFISLSTSIDLDKAIAYLPEKARLVFILHDIEGYRHDEISELLSVKSGTTKAQLHRARKLLRKAIEK